MIRIGNVIKELRAERGLRQSDLANAIGVASNTVTQYENDTIRPSYEVLVDIAAFFSVSTDYLLGLKDF
jgi:transcriptional regulator with XRE-family HTH domain